MSRIIDEFVNVKISIAQSASNSDSFNKLLFIVDAPDGETVPVNYAEYDSVEEITKAGFDEDSDICTAASIAFSNGASSVAIALRSDSQTVAEALDSAFAAGSWYGIALIGYDTSEYSKVAAWAEANEKLFGFTTGEAKNPISGTYYNTHGWYSADITGNNRFLHVAIMAKAFTYEAGEETWAYKTLSGVTPSTLTSSERDSIEAVNLNYYVECAGKNITYPGKTIGGEWIDVVRGKAWLQSDIQNRVYNLFIKNPKVPYTSKGIALIENQMIASLKQAQANGLIAEEEEDDDGNLIEGYTVTVPTISNTTDSERAARNLSNCKFTARLAGAIHLVEITGTLVS